MVPHTTAPVLSANQQRAQDSPSERRLRRKTRRGTLAKATQVTFTRTSLSLFLHLFLSLHLSLFPSLNRRQIMRTNHKLTLLHTFSRLSSASTLLATLRARSSPIHCKHHLHSLLHYTGLKQLCRRLTTW